MIKPNRIAGIFCFALALSLPPASALNIFGSNTVYVPELDRSVHLQKDAGQKEFAVDYRDLIDVNFKLAAPIDTSKCAEWRKALKFSSGDTDASFYQRSQTQLQLQVLSLNPQAVAAAVGTGWSDVGSVVVTKVAVQYQWEKSALTVLAGSKNEYSVEQEVDAGVNSAAGRKALQNNGFVAFTVTNTLFACDLMEGNVALSLSVNATQSAGFHIPPTLRANDIYAISQRIQAVADVLKPEDSGVSASDSLRSLNAAGLLGFQLHQQGYGAAVFKNGEFLDLYAKLFENGATRPVALSSGDATDLVRSMARTKYDPVDFNIAQKLTLKTE